MLLVLCADR